jgi:hypothetical protein
MQEKMENTYTVSAWRQHDWEKVRSRLGHPIPCIEYKLETLTRLCITRIDEHALREFCTPLSETLEGAKKSPLLAKALGSKKNRGGSRCYIEVV